MHKYGGDVIKFSGDALTIIWAAAEPAPMPGHRDAGGADDALEAARAARGAEGSRSLCAL